MFAQGWSSYLNSSCSLRTYKLLKNTFDCEKYLNVLPSNLFMHFARLRLSSHNLRVNLGDVLHKGLTMSKYIVISVMTKILRTNTILFKYVLYTRKFEPNSLKLITELSHL